MQVKTWVEISSSCLAASSSETHPARSLFYSRLSKPLMSSPLPPHRTSLCVVMVRDRVPVLATVQEVHIWVVFLGASLALWSVDLTDQEHSEAR